ncbi:MAG: GDP-L-fucose synthase [Steroidobacteraceae bacterium]
MVALTDRVYLAGHRGLAGSAIGRALVRHGFSDVITRSRRQLDLLDERAVARFMSRKRPQIVILAAARVGGILANSTRPADFIAENLTIQSNVILNAFRYGVRKLVFLGSSCIYPRNASQPIREESLLTGPLETTNEFYAIAKIAGIKLCQALRAQHGFNAIALMPTNLYGCEDNFDERDSHVLAALLWRMHRARIEGAEEVVVWGSGRPRREFLHADDFAEALLTALLHYESSAPINIGSGEDISIYELAEVIRKVVGYRGRFRFDESYPDGTPRKLLDISRMASLGWRAKIPLETGLHRVYATLQRRWQLEDATNDRLGINAERHRVAI